MTLLRITVNFADFVSTFLVSARVNRVLYLEDAVKLFPQVLYMFVKMTADRILIMSQTKPAKKNILTFIPF